MRRLLCRLGFHRWRYGIDFDREGLVVFMVRYCPHCHTMEEVPSEKRDMTRQEVSRG